MIKFLYVLVAIVMLGVIVTIHEFGHYLAGRLCGIGVVEFSIGFGPKIVQFKRKDILYSLRLIPLGGYCSFVGEDEDNDAPNAMNKQAVWKRFITVASGPIMNFVMAFVFCVILLSNYYVAEYLPCVAEIYEDMPAGSSGIQLGDIVTEINGNAVSYDENGINTVTSVIRSADLSQPLEIVIDRDGEEIAISILPKLITDAEGNSYYQIGIAFGSRTYEFGEALAAAPGFMVDFMQQMLNSLKNLVFHGTGVDEVTGPIGIISLVSTEVYNAKWRAVVYLTFILSLNIGIMNLLPLPALDGGRLVFLAVEGIRRKPLPPEKEGMVHGIGFLLLIVLIVFISYKDIVRLIAGG